MALVSIKDEKGNVLMQIDENRFPLKFEATTKQGEREYAVNVTFVNDDKGKRKVKSMYMSG